MLDITELIYRWAKVSNKLYVDEFVFRNDGWHSFLSVEDAIFESIVIEELISTHKINVKKFPNKEFLIENFLFVKFLRVSQPKFLFFPNREKNNYAFYKEILIDSNSFYHISGLSSTLDLGLKFPHAEVNNDNGCFCVPIFDLNFYIEID